MEFHSISVCSNCVYRFCMKMFDLILLCCDDKDCKMLEEWHESELG
jgi:hypothetical protein